MKTKISAFVILFGMLVGLTNTINAQAKEPAWKFNFEKEISWMELSETGILLVGTEDGISGIKPEDGSVIWKNESIKKITQEDFEAIAGTPYIVLAKGVRPPKGAAAGFAAAFAKPSVIIIDVVTGKVVCNTKELGMKRLTGKYYLRSLNALILQGTGKKGMVTMFYDFATGTVIWEKENIFTNSDGPFVDPMVVDADHFIWPSSAGFYKFTIKTGEQKFFTKIKFKDPLPPKVVFNEANTVVYFINKKFGNGYNLNDGSALWKEPIDMDDPADMVFTDKRGIYIAVGNNINLYDYVTGQPKWGEKGKGTKLYDPLMQYIMTDKGLAIQMKDKEKAQYSLNVLNYETGKPLVKKAVKLKEYAKDMRVTPKGLLYRSDVELNILDFETGEPSFPKSIKFKGDNISIDKGDISYIFSGKEFFTFDNQACTYTSKNIDTKFEGKETPNSIELRDKGILLKSSQNLSMIDLDGNVLWHVYYKAPGRSMAAKIALGALSVATAAVAASASAQAGMEKGLNGGWDTQNSRSNAQLGESMGAAAGAGFAAMAKRFKASKDADGFVTILTMLDNGSGVVKINKDSGEKMNDLLLKDKEPIYELDEIGGMLYFKSKEKELSGFKF